MRILFVIAMLGLLGACQFERPIPAPLDVNATELVGDWKSQSTNERVIISDLKAGRLRLLYQSGNTGAVLDAHVIELDGQRYLQTHVLASLKDKSTTALPKKRWMLWKYKLKNKDITLSPVMTLPLMGKSDQAIIAAAKKSLADENNFGPPLKWKWVGSDKPAKL